MREPRFLVQTPDGHLHGYWNFDILLCDVAANSDIRLNFYIRVSGLILRYVPATLDELKQIVELKLGGTGENPKEAV